MKIALIGLGAIGVPIAHKLYSAYKEDFFLIADEERKKKLQDRQCLINGEKFEPLVVSEKDQRSIGTVDLLIICVKNYSLNSILRNITPFIKDESIILPLQNGIYSYGFFETQFPENTILRGYVQGPNTEIVEDGFRYQNPGELHIGRKKTGERTSV